MLHISGRSAAPTTRTPNLKPKPSACAPLLCRTVGVTAVIDKACQPPALRGIYDLRVAEAHHVQVPHALYSRVWGVQQIWVRNQVCMMWRLMTNELLRIIMCTPYSRVQSVQLVKLNTLGRMCGGIYSIYMTELLGLIMYKFREALWRSNM